MADAFPSSEAFDTINRSLKSEDAERKDAVKKGNAIFAFTLKNKEGNTESWHIDLKERGEVAKGEAPSGKKADGETSHRLLIWTVMAHFRHASTRAYTPQNQAKSSCQSHSHCPMRILAS